MKFKIKNTTGYNSNRLMRYLGYTPFHDSYTRRLGGNFYPRFHVHLSGDDNDITISLHLDQKKASYKGVVAHSGEYEDSDILNAEKGRILSLLKTS